MGDGGGNSEEEIRSVEEQIRRVKEKIERVEEKIERVEEQIERVEEQIDRCPGDKERAQLRGKSAQLRAEEAQLRAEEAQLRAEKAQLRGKEAQLRGNLTWTEWLNQRLPPLLFSFSTPPGLRQPKDDIAPASTITWDIWPDVDGYVASAATKSSVHKRIDIEDQIKMTRGSSSEADCRLVYHALLASMCCVLLGDDCRLSAESRSRSLSMRQQHTTADISTEALNDPSADLNNVIRLARSPDLGVQCVDILLKCTDRVFLVVDMKRPSFFRQTGDGDPPNLVKAYENKDLRSHDGQRSHVLAQSIIQLFRYLVRHEIGYAIISSADLSYLVSRVDNSLRISDGISWHHPKFIGALAYFLAKAAGDTTPYVWERGNGDKHSQDCDIDDSQESPDTKHESDHDDYRAPKNLKLIPTDGSVTRSMAGISGLKETPAAHLHLEEHPFATGWSGNIVCGTYKGHVVAVKLAMVCSDCAEALVNEASAYLKLQKYWGKYVPALISHGTTADGNVVYIATELIKGYELGIEGLTPEVVTASFEALNAIHAFGMLHGDIRRDNILVPKGGRRGVRFIDFGFARSTSSAEDCCKELAQLRDIVSKLHFPRSVRAALTAGVIDKGRNLEAEVF